MHIYVFGSLCRGEVTRESDVDLLAVVDGDDSRFDPLVYSVYTYGRIRELYDDGSPFAWHLARESRLVFASDNHDFLADLGEPRPYTRCRVDCDMFHSLFRGAAASLSDQLLTSIFDLSVVFLSVRNFATCYSLGLGRPIFARDSALRLGMDSLNISNIAFSALERSRILSIRGVGEPIHADEIGQVVAELNAIDEWMTRLSEGSHG